MKQDFSLNMGVPLRINPILVVFALIHQHQQCNGQTEYNMSQLLMKLYESRKNLKTAAVFHAKDNNTRIDSTAIISDCPQLMMHQIMKCLNIPIRVFFEASPISPIQQKKNPAVDIIILTINFNVKQLLTDIDLIRSLRIIGPRTKMLVIGDILTEEDVKEILKKVWSQLRIAYITVLFETCGAFKLFSWNPYDVSRSSTSNPINLLNAREFFSNILPRDFHGYELRVGFRELPPYVFPPDQHGNFFRGTVPFAIRAIAKKLNLGIISFNNTDGSPSVVLKGNELNGFFRSLHEQEIDVYASGATLFPAYLAFADTLPYSLYDEQVWVMQATVSVSHFSFLYRGLSIVTWSLYFIVISLCAVLVHVTQFSSNTPNATSLQIYCIFFLYTLAIALESGVKLPKRFRPFVVLMLCTFLVLSTCYKSSLFSALRSQEVSRQVQSVEEAFDRGYLFRFYTYTVDKLKISEEQIFQSLFSSDRHSASPNLTENLLFVLNSKIAVTFTTKLFLQHAMADLDLFDGHGKPTLHMLHQYTNGIPTTIFMSPGNPLADYFQKYVMLFTERGLFVREQAMIALEDKMIALQRLRSRHNVQDEGRQSLSLTKLSAVFWLHILFSLSSVLVFFIELLYNKSDSTIIIPELGEC